MNNLEQPPVITEIMQASIIFNSKVIEKYYWLDVSVLFNYINGWYE